MPGAKEIRLAGLLARDGAKIEEIAEATSIPLRTLHRKRKESSGPWFELWHSIKKGQSYGAYDAEKLLRFYSTKGIGSDDQLNSAAITAAIYLDKVFREKKQQSRRTRLYGEDLRLRKLEVKRKELEIKALEKALEEKGGSGNLTIEIR